MSYVEKDLINSAGNLNLKGYSLIEMNNIVTGSSDITFRRVNVKPYRFNKTYMN